MKYQPISWLAWLAIVVWTLVLGASLFWNLRSHERETMDMAYAEAKANLNKDITLRRWATDHGGVYVPITEKQKSIPWLDHVPGRDVTTTDGRQLTLLNPASVARQMMDRYAQDYGVRGRITGLKYLNPGNAPDPWEKMQLEAFTRGEKQEVWEVSNLDGQAHLRYLRAMFMEPGCEKCHAILGYKLGDMRGATGLNLPLASYYQQIEIARRDFGLTHGAIWLFGLAGIGFSSGMARRREQALRQSKAIIDSADEAIISKTLDGVIKSWNSGAERMLGYTPEEIIGSPMQMLVPADRLDAELAILAHVLRGDKIDFFETIRRCKDGRLLDISVSAFPIFDESGAVIGASEIARDITERKRVAMEVARLAAIVENSNEAILSRSLDGKILSWNAGAEKMLGFKAAEILGKSIATILPPELQARLQENTEAMLLGDVHTQDSVRSAKDGRLINVLSSHSPIKDDAGNIVGVSTILQDITKRKRDEDALKESERRLAAVFHASPIGISVSRLEDGSILDANDAALRLYGYARDEVIGHTVAELGIYAHPAQREHLVQQLHAQGSVDGFPIDFRHSGGSVGVIEVSCRVIELHGEPHLVAMMVDVTEKKRLEEVHLQAQKLESMGTLTGGIAHDFNNILAAIRGNADLAAEDVGPDHAAAESLQEIRKASIRAHELVRRIMAFGRPREAKQDVVDLSALVDEVLKLLRPTIPAGISLKKSLVQDTPHVLADVGQIHEALVNLTTNAAYAIGKTVGVIEYRLDPVEVSDKLAHSISGLKPGRYARLAVTDSGYGMDAATMERIFDAFYTTKPVGEGTGLGLSMVHGIMKGHGGAVTVESTPGKGSSFVLYFPAAKEQAFRPEHSPQAQSLLTTGQRVLYVDDEEALVSLAKRVISRLGHSISGFTDPKAAFAAFRTRPQDFDVLVTDLSMPQMSGFDLAREVLALRPEMPVLMTTGNIGAEDVQHAREAGIREVILKPVSVEELGRVLDRVLRTGKPDETPSA